MEEEYGISSILSLCALFYYLKGRAFFRKWELDRAKDQFQLALKHLDNSSQRDNSNVKACCFNELGRVAYYKHSLPEALHLTRTGLVAFTEDMERTEIKAVLMSNQVIYLEVMKQYEKALNAVEQLDDYISHKDAFTEVKLWTILQMYISYASILNELNMRERAKEYAQKGVRIAKLNKEYDYLFTLWVQSGIIYTNLGEWDQAEAYYVKALEIEPKMENRNLLSFGNTHYGLLLIKKHEWNKAREIIKMAIQISRENHDEIQKIESLTTMGKYFLEQQQFQDAIEFFSEAKLLTQKSQVTRT